MGYIDQFIVSVTFNIEKVIEFRGQNIWKSILYLLVFVIATGVINAFLTWESSFQLLLNEGGRFADGFDVDAMRLAHAFTQYLLIFFDLIVHFIMISVIAYAGSKGYQRVGEVTYGESWNVTAYGISAPILVRLVVQTMGWELQIMTFAYWGAIMIFSMLCVRRIVNLPK